MPTILSINKLYWMHGDKFMETWTINDRDLNSQIKQARKAGISSISHN